MKALKLSQMLSILALSLAAVSIIPACGGGGGQKSAAAFQPAAAAPTIHVNDQPALVIVPGSVVSTQVSIHKWTFTTLADEVISEIHVTGEYQFVPTGQPSSGFSSLLSTTLTVNGTDPTNGTTGTVGLNASDNVTLPKVPGRYLQFHSTFQVKMGCADTLYQSYPDSTSFTIETSVFHEADWSGNIKNLRLMVVTVPCQRLLASPQIVP